MKQFYVTILIAFLTVDMTANGNATISITDISGRIILTKNINNTNGFFSEKINVSALANGFYFLTAETNGSRETQRFEKQ